MPSSEIRTIICPVCRKPTDVEWSPYYGDGPRPIWADAYDAKWTNILNTIVVCDPCNIKLKTMKDEDSRHLKASIIVQECLDRGLIPPDLRTCSLAASSHIHESCNDDRKTAYAFVRAWQGYDTKSWAWFLGDRGTGKTFAARCILNKALDQAKSAGEITAYDIQQHAIMFVEGAKKLRDMKCVDVLLIEELGIPTWRKDGVVALREIIDYRYRMSLPTLVTSNVGLADMKRLWLRTCGDNPSIVESMTDRMRKFSFFAMKGQSIRQMEFAGQREPGDEP